MAEPGPTLNDLRGEIDRLDDALLDLLTRRARIAAEIAPLKAGVGAPLLRPGREAEVLRRLVARAGDGVDPLAVVRIWREIMSAALRLQGPFSVAVSAPESGPSCWGLARTQYGVSTPMTGAAGPVQALALVASGSASVAIVPFPGVEEPDPWWSRLATDGAGVPRVVARLPVAEGLSPLGSARDGLAVAAMIPEPSGDDRSLVVIETREPMSRTAITRALADAGFIVHFAASRGAGGNLHLAEVDGFIEPAAPALRTLSGKLGDTARHVTVIGAYAVPLKLEGIGRQS